MLPCFLAFHNENKDIEFLFSKENSVWKNPVGTPTWSAGSTYRIKPDEPNLIKNTSYTLSGLLLLKDGVFDNFGSKLMGEREISDAYFAGKAYFKEEVL